MFIENVDTTDSHKINIEIYENGSTSPPIRTKTITII